MKKVIERKKEMMRIKDVISISNGFFSHINFEFPEFIEKSNLDIDFFSQYASKTVAPIIINFQEEGVSQLTDSALDSIGAVLLQRYSTKWTKQLAVLNLEYDPIYNYSDKYNETYSKESDGTRDDESSGTTKSTRTDDLTEQKTLGTSISGTRTDNLQNQRTDNLSSTTNTSTSGNVFGFNSSIAVPDTTASENSTRQNTGTQTNKNTGTQTNQVVNSGSDTTKNTGTQATDVAHETTRAIANKYAESGTREYNHLGNIGNHPTQDLITKEIELWRWNFIQEILEDVKDFVTIPYYIS